MMDPEQFRQLRARFEELLAAPGEERERRVVEIGERDPALAAELRRMLAHSARSSELDGPAIASLAMSGAEPEEEARPAMRPGSQIGPYRLEEELGRGGMGMVYLASRSDGSFQKRVAIKILRRDRVDDLFLRRFHRERQILAQLNHPHIAAILDAGTSPEGDPYFVMEYVDGVPVTEYCRARALTVRQKLDLFLQICDAVQHAHRNLTVHRDLKPSNILVTPAGAVKLLDFGIAKLLEPITELPAEAHTVAVLTPEYASPEQIRNEPITTASDLFSLGMLLYEMLAGRHPFGAKERLPHEVMRAITEDDPAPIAVVGGELNAIVLTALRKEPAWRYPSVEQLADDVGRYLRGQPVLAKGNRWPYRFGKFARRQWLPLTAAAVLVAVLVAGILATRRQARVAEQAREAAEVARNQAEQERGIAERNQRVATEQRAVAEARTREAEQERQKERQRYRDVRSLAASLLFELHDGIRDLAGSTTARRLIVEKAQRQLELLRADSESDPGLIRDLAAAYERMGELQVDPRHPDKSSAGAALNSYRHAVDLRRKIAEGSKASAADRRDLALSLSKLGDGEFLAGDMKAATDSYQSAWTMAKSLVHAGPSDASMRRAMGTIDERRCTVLLAAGNNAGSMEACKEGIATLSPIAAGAPDDVELQRVIATTEASYANALRMSKNAPEAVRQGKLAMESLERLQTLAPSNAEYRRLASSTGFILASTLAATGDQQASLDQFRRSVRAMEVAIEIDPSDLNSPLRLAVTLLAFSRRLASGGKENQTSAHEAAQEALGLLERTASRPGSGALEWNEYADALLKAGWPDLTQPAKALQLAQRAVASTSRKNAFFLDTLAWAYFRTGDASKAAETERDALRLLPAGAKGGLHDELQHGLDTFLRQEDF